ncbi:MAG: PAS domain S-box protein [Deltaproteobacteria bacterium]|nr:PAS domain S-box protein [Deltaproteobacteria bacterium]
MKAPEPAQGVSGPISPEEMLRIQRDLALALHGATSLEAALSSCLEAAFLLSPMDCGGIYMVDPGSGAVDLRVHRNLGEAFLEAVRAFPGDHPKAQMVRDGTALFLRCRDLPEHDEVRAVEGLLSIAVLPIRSRGRVIACLNLGSHSQEVIADQARQGLEDLAEQVGNAILRLRTEEELRRSEADHRDLFLHSGDGMVLVNRATEILDVNPAFEQLTGFSLGELRGRRVPDLYVDAPPEDVAASIRTVAEGRTTTRHRRIRRKDGSVVEVVGQGRLLPGGRIIAIYRDETESIRRARDRERTAKLESLGLLAGGIAHDFNNILTAAAGFLEMSMRRHRPGPGEEDHLSRALAALDRARSLTHQLLTFAKGSEPIRQVVSLTYLVPESARFALRGSAVGCHYDFPADLWPVDVDPGQIGQVFHNIVLNAQQSMPGGGEIRIRARNEEPEDGPPDPGAVPRVAVSVEDRGGGIPPEVLPRIFDPYFTTKPNGIGLGLPSAYGIVQRHGGRIGVDVQEGIGSTFTVFLPASPGVRPEPFRAPGLLHEGLGRILVMDDEAAIRSLLLEALGDAGFEVVVTERGEDAIRAWIAARERGRPFDLAIMDLTVPGGMGGRECVQRLRELDPALRAVVSSGYSTDPVMARYREEGFDGVCAKPYRISDMIREIQRVLSTPRGP